MKKWQTYADLIAENFTIVNKDKEEVPFVLNKAQIHFLENSTDRNTILKARKMGFSSVLLAVACIKFIFGKNERCISMSFDKTAAAKQLERAKHFLQSYERINKVKIPFKYNSKHELSWEGITEDGNKFINTLRVGTAQSQGFGRGDDITFLHLTEVSLVTDIDQLLAGVGEAVVNNAMITLETTANGYNSFKTFWDESAAGHRNYQTFFYEPSWEYSKEFVDIKRKELGKLADQEYPLTPQAAFIASGNQFFDNPAIREYAEKVQEPTRIAKFRKFRDFERGEFILVFADTAWGGGDFCAAQFLSQTRLDVPLVYHAKTIASDMTPELHTMLETIHTITGVKPVICYERNNGGIAEIERLAKLNRNNKYTIYLQKTGNATRAGYEDSKKYGWDTTSASRPIMLSMLKDAIDNQLIRIYDEPTITEMFSFVEMQTSSSWKAQAERGAHDDLIMSLAGVWQMFQTERPPVVRQHRVKKKKFDPVTGRVLS